MDSYILFGIVLAVQRKGAKSVVPAKRENYSTLLQFKPGGRTSRGTREIEKVQKRLADLDKLLQKAFEQLALENLSETQFKALTGNHETERQELTRRSNKLEQEISLGKDTLLNIDRFLAVVDRYTDIQKLTPEIVREFVQKIVVYERSEPHKKKNYTQKVDVYFNFVGKVEGKRKAVRF